MNRTTRRTSRKAHRCESCRSKRIQQGDVYLEHVISPDHDDIGNVGWWRSSECADCATRYGRGHLLVVVPS